MRTYHLDKEIDQQVLREAAESERIDMEAGFPPRWWQCPSCGKQHNRGHAFYTIGIHRCLQCGYAGEHGVISDKREELCEPLEWTS